MSIRYRMNPTIPDSAVLVDGQIIRVAQLGPDQWLFDISADAPPGQEQSQIRLKLQLPDDGKPGYFQATLTVEQVAR
jgi:hypothetical protein